MRDILKNSFIQIRKESYLNMLIVIVPLLNFLVGINVDLYAPSLPDIAKYYGISMSIAKNTITITMIGFTVGCIVLGTLLDILGRRPVILGALLIYLIASIAALFCHTITQLMIARFIQGMMTGAFSIGPRAVITDHFNGNRLTVALMYTSVSYGLGPIIGPFIGGVLQDYFGWKANFMAFALFSVILGLIFLCFVNESFHQLQRFSPKKILRDYFDILKHGPFLAGTLIVGGIHIEQMIYPTLGPFLVEDDLHGSAMTYGNTALLVGAGFLLGTLTNRVLVKKYTSNTMMMAGFFFLLLGVLLQVVFSFLYSMNLWTLVLPFIILIFGTGFLFANILVYCLKLFPNNVGIASAIIASLLMLIGAIGVLIVSALNVHALMDIAIIMGVVIMFQIIIFFVFFKPAIK